MLTIPSNEQEVVDGYVVRVEENKQRLIDAIQKYIGTVGAFLLTVIIPLIYHKVNKLKKNYNELH